MTHFTVQCAYAAYYSNTVTVEADDRTFTMRARIDTPFERLVFRAGGILPSTLRSMMKSV